MKRKDPTAAERQARRRERLKEEQGSLRDMATWSGKRLPIHRTVQDDEGDPQQWSAVPALPPPRPSSDDPAAANDAPPPPEAVVMPKPSEPTNEQREAAAKAAGLVLLVWGLGGAAIAELAEDLKADPSASGILRVAAEQAAAHWGDPSLASLIHGAAERTAIRYGIAFVGAPPDEIIVGAALVTPLAVFAANFARKKNRTRARVEGDDGRARPVATPPPKAQDWDVFGEIPLGGVL